MRLGHDKAPAVRHARARVRSTGEHAQHQRRCGAALGSANRISAQQHPHVVRARHAEQLGAQEHLIAAIVQVGRYVMRAALGRTLVAKRIQTRAEAELAADETVVAEPVASAHDDCAAGTGEQRGGGALNARRARIGLGGQHAHAKGRAAHVLARTRARDRQCVLARPPRHVLHSPATPLTARA